MTPDTPDYSRHSVLITGGSGFLGRALAAELCQRNNFKRVCIYSRGEYAQAVARTLIEDPNNQLRWFIGDVRDGSRLRRAMEGIDVVIHAAALKRIEVGEYNPREMVLTNVMGSINVIEAAQDVGVAKVVAVSSDKACAPLNAYGATKLVMEKLMLAANNTVDASGPAFAVVRYGNVAGSTGSVIQVWRDLKRRGQVKVPVTDPNCTRFWMDVGQAVELILWTVRKMHGGETVVPLLPAFRLSDVAKAMDLEIEVLGIGAGEKLDESMIALLESPEFRYCAPYLVRGGIANQIPLPNAGGIKLHMLDVDELRARLKELP